MCKCSAVLTGAVGAGLVSALPTAEVAVGDFYSTPMPLPDVAAGAIIRTEPAHLALSVPGQPEMIPASATRIMYRSNDTHDEPTAVVGSYLDPAAPWTGPGERPLVAFAGGSKGQGDQCAPSKLLAKRVDVQPPVDVMVEFDVPALYALLARGMAVVMTGYQGLGTPAVDDFLNRKSQGYAVLDAALAASALPGNGNGIGAGAPVRLYAHSDGKGNLAPAYAWLLNGVAADYPDARPELDAELNDTGKAILAEEQGKCAVLSGIAQRFPSTAQWTTSGAQLVRPSNSTPTSKCPRSQAPPLTTWCRSSRAGRVAAMDDRSARGSSRTDQLPEAALTPTFR
ncbi:lipase family protein [Nocardia salmonicida]|uniref:lipase family protein n=1 Tax=Nocardia salmonicida TaxID=53431 RepID=UPI0033D00B72